MKSEIKTNYTNEKLYCIYSKEKIEIGESYFTVTEEYGGERLTKTYKEEYFDFIEEED